MKEFISYLSKYTSLLKEGAVWRNSNEILAPVINDKDEGVASDNYIYEFYCYISIIVDLMSKYDIEFVEGTGKFKYKFPQAATEKKGKPRFNALKNGKLEFQICAGTKVSCEFGSEENHPDISFQLPGSSDNPTQDDLIFIMDAKYKEGPKSVLPKSEVYKFGMIVILFNLRTSPAIEVKFTKYNELKGNCLLTNGQSYSNSRDISYLKKFSIKEVESFFPGSTFKVLG